MSRCCILCIYTRRAGWVWRFFGNGKHNAYTWHIDELKVRFETFVDRITHALAVAYRPEIWYAPPLRDLTMEYSQLQSEHHSKLYYTIYTYVLPTVAFLSIALLSSRNALTASQLRHVCTVSMLFNLAVNNPSSVLPVGFENASVASDAHRIPCRRMLRQCRMCGSLS